MDTISPKGTKFMAEIELTKDCVVIQSCIGRSIYADEDKRAIEDTFKINVLNIKTIDQSKDELIEKIAQVIKNHK